MTPTDLYCNTDSTIYLRLSGSFFKRLIGRGWVAISPEQAPDLAKFFPLHEKQWAVYKPLLEEAGLL